MKRILPTILLFLAAPAGFAELKDLAAREFKEETAAACGDDAACKAAVEAQFEGCHNKYLEEWNGWLESSAETEAEKLRAYSQKVYTCIVDGNGKPYFRFGNDPAPAADPAAAPPADPAASPPATDPAASPPPTPPAS